MNVKLNWKIQSKPTGQYASFEKRGWPEAYYINGDIAAAIYCTDSYDIKIIGDADHDLLTVQIADYSVNPWRWRRIKKRCFTLQEAKDLVQEILQKYPQFIPANCRNQ